MYWIISILFTGYLKLRYFNRIKLSGSFILDGGFVNINIANGTKLIIKGSISLRQNSDSN